MARLSLLVQVSKFNELFLHFVSFSLHSLLQECADIYGVFWSVVDLR